MRRKVKVKPIVFVDRPSFGESRLMPWDPLYGREVNREHEVWDPDIDDDGPFTVRRSAIEYDPEDLPGYVEESAWERQSGAIRPRAPACARVLSVAAHVLTEATTGRTDTNCTKRGKKLLMEAAGLAIGGRCVVAKRTLTKAMKSCAVRTRRRVGRLVRARRRGWID